jgi:hypothetical protein
MSNRNTLISIEFSKEINEYFLNYYTINQWEEICSSLSIPPCMTYIRIISQNENDIDNVSNMLQEFINEVILSSLFNKFNKIILIFFTL